MSELRDTLTIAIGDYGFHPFFAKQLVDNVVLPIVEPEIRRYRNLLYDLLLDFEPNRRSRAIDAAREAVRG